MSDDEPKIIIDEDWKSQVEREKSEVASQETSPELAEEQQQEMSLFDNLVASISAQTLMSLGLVGMEDQVEVMLDLPMANHLIQTLIMLQEKTAGNVTDDEARNLAEALSELQRVFAVRVQQVEEAPLTQGDGAPEPGPSL